MKDAINPRLTPAALAAKTADNFLTAITPGDIEAQEAAGQAEFCAREVLPSEMRPNREAFESLGFVFGEEDYNEIFIAATLPKGWTKRATEHSMWSEIVDAEGGVRAMCFYKAAFYDRSAFMVLKSKK